MGGALRAIELGYIQHEIQEAAYRYQQALERGEQTVVGVNDFVQEQAGSIERLQMDPTIEAQARAQVSGAAGRGATPAR